MGIYTNTASFMLLNISGGMPHNVFEFVATGLASRAFRAIDETNDEQSVGWVRTDATDNTNFDVPAAFMRDQYLSFSYRRDQRKVPGSALKSQITKAEREYLEKCPELKRVPKREREEIRDRVKLQLLSKTVPSQTIIDLVWDSQTGKVLLFTASVKDVDAVCELFNKTFENCVLRAVSPFERVKNLIKCDDRRSALDSENRATSESLLDLITSNTWVGQDFLAWLFFEGLNDGSFVVGTDGNVSIGDSYAAWIDTKIQLQGTGEGGAQKVVCSGSQDKYIEVKAAMRAGKSISGATICLEHNDSQWKFNLDGEYFAFRSFKCPPIKIERDGVDAPSEMEGVFYEKIYLLSVGIQLLDDLLCLFAADRLTSKWPTLRDRMDSWLVEGE